METIRLITGLVKLELASHVARFIKAINEYELFVTEQEFSFSVSEDITNPGKFSLIKPFSDETMSPKELKEFAWVIGLDHRLHAIYVDLIAIGDIDRLFIPLGQAYRGAMIWAASYIYFVHNHPSGLVEPSMDDLKFTKKLIKAAKLMDRTLLDHIILGNDNDYYSMHEVDLFQKLEEETEREEKGLEFSTDVIRMQELLLEKRKEEIEKMAEEIEALKERLNKKPL